MTSPRPPEKAPFARRAGAWLAWWVLLMSFWVILDDSIATDELLAGAGAAALAAFLAELVTYQAAARVRIRARWLARVLGLPGQVAGDTAIVFAALWRRLARGSGWWWRCARRAGEQRNSPASSAAGNCRGRSPDRSSQRDPGRGGS